MSSSIDIGSPFLLQGQGWALRWFTALWWLELCVGYILLARAIRRGGGDDEDASDLAVYVWIGLFVGARLGHVLFYDLERAVADPTWIVRIWTGGLSGHGAVLGVLLALRLFARRRGMSELEISDRLAYSAGISAVVHRLGNLLNSELVGKPTDGSWGFRFPNYDRVHPPLRHPTQLYEMALGVILLLVVYVCDRRLGREARPRGALTGIVLVVYFVGRFAVEFLKEPEGPLWAQLNVAQLLSLPFIAAGGWIWWRSANANVPAGWRVPEISA